MTARFKPDKGFAGTDAGETQTGARVAPVQFERVCISLLNVLLNFDIYTRCDIQEEHAVDPFGLQQFMSETKKARRSVES